MKRFSFFLAKLLKKVILMDCFGTGITPVNWQHAKLVSIAMEHDFFINSVNFECDLGKVDVLFSILGLVTHVIREKNKFFVAAEGRSSPGFKDETYSLF